MLSPITPTAHPGPRTDHPPPDRSTAPKTDRARGSLAWGDRAEIGRGRIWPAGVDLSGRARQTGSSPRHRVGDGKRRDQQADSHATNRTTRLPQDNPELPPIGVAHDAQARISLSLAEKHKPE